MIDHDRLDAIVSEAADIALSQWPGAGGTVKVWEKTPGHPVCDADLEVDAFLKGELARLLPSAGWLSEETANSAERLDKRLTWVVDPIDGTRDYLRGRTGWAVSVALVSDRRPLLASLHAPAREERWRAIAGQGAWRNGERLEASSRRELAGARWPADAMLRQDSIFTQVDKPNSIALRIAMIAADEADLVATMRWGYEWDVAAAMLIAREAGALVTDVLGRPIAYNQRDPRSFGLLVASPHLHAAAAEYLRERANTQFGKSRPLATPPD